MKTSKGQLLLQEIIETLLPLETIVTEHSVGERLRLDLYYPRYRLAFEYHGRQHYEFVEHFHGDMYGFQDSLKRDARKAELCKAQGIVLLIFKYTDTLDEDSVFERLHTAINDSDFVPPKKPDKKRRPKPDKDNPFHKQKLIAQRKYRKEQYQKMKEYKKKSNGR